jgi:fructuronate reductase
MTSAVAVGPRLSAVTLARARSSAVPGYDRSGPPPIVHIGLGGFARAHLGVYADDLLRIGGAGLIHGVSLHSRRTEAALVPQDCLYTVTEREPDCEPRRAVVGSVASVATGHANALAALCAPTTTFVTLTVTEKGYDVPPEDLERPERPGSAPGLLALALAQRRAAGTKPPIIASLDNVADNGSLLRAKVTEVGACLGLDLAEWIAEEVTFTSSVVDRMVPTPTPRDLDATTSWLGLADLGAVATERHRSWVMTADERLAPWADVGVELVPDVVPYEQRKLWLLNGAHSALAYGGLLAGCATIAEAAADHRVSRFVRGLVDDVLGTSLISTALRPAAFADEAFGRFLNPNLRHSCEQVAADGSRKLPQRFLPVVAARESAGLDTMRFATVAAIWVAAASGMVVDGVSLPAIDDPEAARLRAAGSSELDHLVRLALRHSFDETFTATVAAALRRLARLGLGLLEEQV